MTVSSPSPLLVILILIYIKNPLNLYSSPIKYLTNSILINWCPYLLSYSFNTNWFSISWVIISLYYFTDLLLVLAILILLYMPDGLKVIISASIFATSTALNGIIYWYWLPFYCNLVVNIL